MSTPIAVGSGAYSEQQVSESGGTAPFQYGLKLLVPGATNPLLKLLYTSCGKWDAGKVMADNPDLVDQNFGMFAYGVPTPIGVSRRADR